MSGPGAQGPAEGSAAVSGSAPFRVGFAQLSRAFRWASGVEPAYGAERLAEEVRVEVLDAADGSVRYSFLVAFHVLGADPRPAVQVRVLHDAFAAYTDLAPFFEALAARSGRRLSPVEVMGLLRETVGAVDLTSESDAGRRARPADAGPSRSPGS